MTGTDLARECMKIRSDVPIILCTGFAMPLTPEEATSIGIRGYIAKPVVLRKMATIAREVLDHKIALPALPCMCS